MFLFNLFDSWKKVVWVILYFFVFVCALLYAAPSLKRLGSGSSTSCARVTTSTGNEFSGFLGSDAAQMRSGLSASSSSDGEVIIFTSDILIEPGVYIVANGHAVEISGQTEAEAGSDAETTIWIDENDNGVKDADETVTEKSLFLANVYLFAGSDEQSVTCDNISIKMTGGEIGAIFAGGFNQDVRTQSVDVEITGGCVHYVDCGSHGPTGNYSLYAKSINVLLRDCVYRSNMSVNGLKANSINCPNVTVYDYSEHRDVESFTRFTPTFKNYVLKLEQNSYLMGGNVTIPADMDFEARVLVVKENAKVNNLGKVAVSRCENIHMLEGSVWSGTPIKTVHENMSLDYYTYSNHYQTCSKCSTKECRAHVWSYFDNGDGTHTKRCGVCGYSYSEDCSMLDEYNSTYLVRKTCKYCYHQDEQENSFAIYNSGCQHSSNGYISINHLCAEFNPSTVSQRFAFCANCKQGKPFALKSGTNSYLPYTSLAAICLKSKNAGTNNVTVKMYGTAFDCGIPDTVYIGGTLTLDMNGCDIEREIIVKSGTLKIINSQFQPTGMTNSRYARITKEITASTSATIDAEGCWFSNLRAGSSSYATYRLGNVKCSYLRLYGTSNLVLTDKVVVEKSLYTSYYLGTSLPSGYVIGEMLADGTWLSLYDHTATRIPYYIGPEERFGYESTAPIAIMPCQSHKLTSATSQGTSGHQGTCTLCGETVTEAHDMTEGQSQATTSQPHVASHKLKCSVCSYAGTGVAFHDYDNNGRCIVCQEKAAASLRGTSFTKKRFFLSYDKAMSTLIYSFMKTFDKDEETVPYRGEVFLYAQDTISLYDNQTNTTSGYPADIITVTGRFKAYFCDRVFVEGNGYTLNNTASTISSLSELFTKTELTNIFEAKHDLTYATTLYENGTKKMLVPEQGYYARKSGNYIYPTICSHASATFEKVESRNQTMDFHSYSCTECRSEGTQSHSYVYNSGTRSYYCSRCNALRSEVVEPVARIGTLYFTSINDAWNYVNPTYNLVTGGSGATFKLLKDIKLSADQCLTLTKYAKFIFDGTDDNGVEHSITATYSGSGDCNPVIDARLGKITIKSGIFQGFHEAVITESTSHLVLEGGTFKRGTDASGVYPGLVNNTTGVLYNLSKGYSIVDEQKKALSLKSTDNSLLTSVSGTVMPCSHSNFISYDEKPATCTADGNEACIYCNNCQYYIDSETFAYSVSMPKVSATGHQFVNNICTICGAHEGAIKYWLYGLNGSLNASGEASDFSSVWNYICNLGAVDEEDELLIQLQCDVDLPEGEALTPVISQCPKIRIDLNGYNLNLRDAYFVTGNKLFVTDSSKSGNSVMSSMKMIAADSDLKWNTVSLDGVQLRTSKFGANNLSLINNADIVFDGGLENSASVSFKKITMTNGCCMEGENCGSFIVNGERKGIVYDFDVNEVIVDLAHELTAEQQIGPNDWISYAGTSSFSFPSKATVSNKVSVLASDGNLASSCFRWKAVKQDVEHTLNGRRCSVCGLNTHHYLLHDKTTYTDGYHQYIGAAYKRSIANPDVWEPLYAPMSFKVDDYAGTVDFADIYSFGRLVDTNGNGRIDDGDDTWLIVDLMTSGLTDPNYPYLIRGKSAVSVDLAAYQGVLYQSSDTENSCSTAQNTYTFRGTNIGESLNSTSGILMLDSQGKLSEMSNHSVAPQRWYVQTAGDSNSAELRQAYSNGLRVMVIGEDISQTTALQLLRGESVEVDLDGQHYTLDGRKATKTQSGLQIVNGHKVLVK